MVELPTKEQLCSDGKTHHVEPDLLHLIPFIKISLILQFISVSKKNFVKNQVMHGHL